MTAATEPRAAKCPVCGHDRHSVFRNLGAVDLLSCGGCGLGFIPEGGPADKAQYERDETSPTAYYESTVDADRFTFIERLKLFERHIKPGRLLDVGCNIGTFLECARERGWDVAGVEPNPTAHRACDAKGLRVHRGFFDASCADLLRGEFDAVHMGDVIEHVYDPVGFLALARRALKPGGVVGVLTPNFDSRLARAFQIKPREHVLYFTADTLGRAMKAAGLDVAAMHIVTRLRDLGSIDRGTTPLGTLGKAIVRTLRATRTARVASRLLYALAGDEILAFGRTAAPS